MNFRDKTAKMQLFAHENGQLKDLGWDTMWTSTASREPESDYLDLLTPETRKRFEEIKLRPQEQ